VANDGPEKQKERMAFGHPPLLRLGGWGKS